MIAGSVLVVAAIIYALGVGGGGVTFDITPLAVGLAAVLAGLIGRAWRLVPIGLVLAGWGLAVVLMRHGPLPEGREAPAFLVGAGVGMLAAQVVARRHRLTLTGATITLIIGGLSFYAAYDIAALGRWPVWAVSLAAWGTYEAFLVRRQAKIVTDG